MDSVKELLGTEPQYHEKGDYYTPSKAAIAVAAPSKTNYTPIDFPNAYSKGDLTILVPCAEDQYMACTNGKRFETGDHPVEVFVTLLHLHNAGFNIEFATPSGKPVVFEEWAMPMEDTAIIDFRESLRAKWENPKTLGDIAADPSQHGPYISVLCPGGQGVIEVLPMSTDLKKILQWFIAEDKYIMTICHGPSALLALALDEKTEDFPFKGYEIELFPKYGDVLAPAMGYIPGDMPYYFQDKLKELGMDIKTLAPIGHARVDRKLLSADGPFAANKLGILAANTLLQSLSDTSS